MARRSVVSSVLPISLGISVVISEVGTGPVGTVGTTVGIGAAGVGTAGGGVGIGVGVAGGGGAFWL